MCGMKQQAVAAQTAVVGVGFCRDSGITKNIDSIRIRTAFIIYDLVTYEL